jgi:hypothetical protein
LLKFLLLSLFFFFIGLEANEIKWKKLTKQEREKSQLEFNYNQIKNSLSQKFSYTKEILVPYSNCKDDFPLMPGQFPCSFLSDEHSIKKSVEDINSENSEGGRIGIKVSKEKNLLGGKVLLVGEDESSDGSKNEDKLVVYYLKNNYISHYTFKNFLTIFKWKGEKGEETLVSIFVIRFDDKNRVFASKRIDFK